MARTSARDQLGRNVLAGAVAGAVQISIFNPLDTLRIRWQLAGPASSMSMAGFARSVAQTEGPMRGLYLPGLGYNVFAVALSQGLRMGLYPSARDLMTPPGAARPDQMMLAGLASGSVAYAFAAPLWLLKTRSQAAAQLGRAEPLPRSPLGYWLGCSPLVVRGALLTSGQMAGYDATKRLCRDRLGDGPVRRDCSRASHASRVVVSFVSGARRVRTRCCGAACATC